MNRAGVLSQQGAYQAFVPKPLPPCDPPLLMDDRTIHLLAEARGALGKLEGLSEVIPNPEYFIAMYVRKEALLSSQIEGTQASLVEVFAAEKQIRSSVSFEIREVINYVRALNFSLDRVQQLPFSLRLLKETHSILLEDVRGHHRNRGEFRSTQNWIGRTGTSIEDAEFVPPPAHMVPVALSDLEKYYCRRSRFLATLLPDTVAS